MFTCGSCMDTILECMRSPTRKLCKFCLQILFAWLALHLLRERDWVAILLSSTLFFQECCENAATGYFLVRCGELMCIMNSALSYTFEQKNNFGLQILGCLLQLCLLWVNSKRSQILIAIPSNKNHPQWSSGQQKTCEIFGPAWK